MSLKLSNNAVSSLAASITSGATTLSIQGGDAGKFPVLGAGDWHPATIIDPANNMEIVRVTARAGATLTIARAQEGTTAKAFAAGSRIDVRITAACIGSMAEQSAGSVAITGGTITDITDITVADGGTGASTPEDARANLGLGNVSNTSDADKPVSTAQQAALDLKANKSGGTFTGAVIFQSSVDLSGNTLKNVGSGVADYLKGLITSKSSAFVISVAAGEIKGNGKLVLNAAPFTKNLNAVWVAGSGNGGRLEAAALTANTSYFLHALMKDSDGSFDWGFSTSATAPTIPAGYSWVGRFDWCYTNAGLTAIWDYTQVHNMKYLAVAGWFSTAAELPAALYTPPTSSPIPLGIRSAVILNLAAGANSGGSSNGYINDGDALNGGGGPISCGASSGIGITGAGVVRTNLLRQVRIQVNFGGTGGSFSVNTNGVDDYTLNRKD